MPMYDKKAPAKAGAFVEQTLVCLPARCFHDTRFIVVGTTERW